MAKQTWNRVQLAATETRELIRRRLPPDTSAEARFSYHAIAAEAWLQGYDAAAAYHKQLAAEKQKGG